MSEITHNDEADLRFICFSLGEEEYAIPLLDVREVIAVPEMIHVPFTPKHFCGVTNIRGQVISVLDIRKKFHMPDSQSSEKSVIICEFKDLVIGVLVDSVNAVINPKRSEIAARPVIESKIDPVFITNLYRKGDGVVLFLDIMKALDLDDRKAIDNMKKSA